MEKLLFGPKLDFMVKDALGTVAMEQFKWIIINLVLI
jgi:hypothetical protein